MKTTYYSLEQIKKRKARYNVIFGKRSNGKTFAVMLEGLARYLEDGSQMALVRRWDEDLRGKNGSQIGEDLIYDGHGVNRIEKMSGGRWNSISYRGLKWYLERVYEDEKGQIQHEKDDTPFIFGFGINVQEHDKSHTYPRVRTVLFDEFISRTMYLTDEFVLFCNVLSTIIRKRDDVIIYMCGNAINKYNPYFKEMGLTRAGKMKPGDIDVYEYGDSGLRVAVEFADARNKHEKSDVYFAFNNPKLRMITGKDGVWELDVYPHCPEKYKPRDILFTYFIEFADELFQAEIISPESGNVFTFIHRKTTELQSPDSDLIYSPMIDSRPNWRRRITQPVSDVERRILSFYKAEKVFYQDNEVGNAIYNYLMWCKSAQLNVL